MKLQLIVQSGSLAGRKFELNEGWLLLGRSAEAAVQFAEPVVSGRHVIIQARPDGYELIDQQSTNGVFVNGARVRQARLQAGDEIQLGLNGPRLTVLIEAAADAWATNPAISVNYDTQVPEPPPAPPVDEAPRAHGLSQRLGLQQDAANLGLFDPDHDAGKQPKSLRVGCLALSGGGLALLLLALTVTELGPFAALVGAVMAFLPAVFYLMIILWLDRYDPEPLPPLVFAFGWGALFAILVSGIVNSLFGVVASDAFGAVAGDTLTGVISAPIIEEATKGFGVLLIMLLFRREFDSVVDGIVYAGVVALGFATMENIDYYGKSLLLGGAGQLAGTFFVRGILAPFSHVLFTSMTGIGCGIARETHNKTLRWVMPLVGYVGAMFLHALWNGLASFSAQTFFLGYFFLEVPLFLIFVTALIFLIRREGRILRQMLAAEVQRGLITEQQLRTVVSIFRRTNWVLEALGDTSRLNARRQFLRAVAKLGLCHWHVARATAAQTHTTSFPLIPRLQAEVFALRDQVG